MISFVDAIGIVVVVIAIVIESLSLFRGHSSSLMYESEQQSINIVGSKKLIVVEIESQSMVKDTLHFQNRVVPFL